MDRRLATLADGHAMEPIQFPKINDRARAFDLIRELSFRRGEFILSSGKASSFYLDMKPTMFNPEGCGVLARLIFQRIKPLEPHLVGGLEMGAVPLISPVAMVSFQSGRPISGFFVRQKAKSHGTKKLIETAEPMTGKRVTIIDDVTTTGGSAMEAVNAVREAGAEVALVLSIVDREEGAAALYAGNGLSFDSLFKVGEFLRA